MSDLLDRLEDEELKLNKDVNTVDDNPVLKGSKGLMEMIADKKKKPIKIPVAVYLTEEVSDKLKTLSINSGLSIANILETAINELTLDLTVDEKAVKKYDKNNKSRGRKKNSK